MRDSGPASTKKQMQRPHLHSGPEPDTWPSFCDAGSQRQHAAGDAGISLRIDTLQDRDSAAQQATGAGSAGSFLTASPSDPWPPLRSTSAGQGQGLRIDQAGVVAVGLGGQLGMGAHLHHPPRLQHADLVRRLERSPSQRVRGDAAIDWV